MAGELGQEVPVELRELDRLNPTAGATDDVGVGVLDKVDPDDPWGRCFDAELRRDPEPSWRPLCRRSVACHHRQSDPVPLFREPVAPPGPGQVGR